MKMDDWLGHSRPLSDAEREVRVRLLNAEADEYQRRGLAEAAVEVRAEAAALERPDDGEGE